MKILDRFIMLIYSIILLCLSFFMIIIPFDLKGIFSVDNTMRIIDMTRGNFLISIIGLILLVFALVYLISLFKTKKKDDKKSFLAINNDYGEIVIYEETVIGLVENVSKEFAGIDRIKTYVRFLDGEINLYLNGQAETEINIPQISSELQFKIKEEIEEATGAKVGEVNVEIVSVKNSR